MMSSTMPSATYSCSGSALRLVKGRTATEGLSGGFIALGVSTEASPTVPGSSRTAPTKRKPLRGNVFDQPLLFSGIGDGAAHDIDAGGQRRIRDNALLSDGRDQIVFAHHPLALAKQILEM